MFIQTELTPNPKTVKFIPGRDVSPNNSVTFTKGDDLEISPLAKRLFLIDGIHSIFLGADFISITKEDTIEWQVLKPLILSQIMQLYMSNEKVINEKVKNIYKEISSEDKEIADQIKELLETRVRPSVAEHGGDIVFHNYSKGVLELEMKGACAGCPSSMATLKMGIENMLKHYIPEVMEVKEVI